MADVAVFGAGIIGLTTARQFLSRGFRVAIFAEHQLLSRSVCSTGAGGLWMPFHVEPAASCVIWAEQTLALLLEEKRHHPKRSSLIELLPVVQCKSELRSGEKPPPWSSIPALNYRIVDRDGFARLGLKAKLPSGMKGAHVYTAPVVHAEPYMQSLREELEDSGASFHLGMEYRIKTFSDAKDRADQVFEKVDVIVNCTGLASQSLAADGHLIPGRGVVMKVRRTPDIDAAIMCEEGPYNGTDIAYAIPRGPDLVTIGGTYLENDYSSEPSGVELQSLSLKASYLYPSLQNAAIDMAWVGLRPVRSKGVVISAMPNHPLSKDRPVVVAHNYGHGGGGWSLFQGCAVDCANRVVDALNKCSILGEI